MKPAKLRPRAEGDLVDAAAYCSQKGGRELGERMFDAALAALSPIQRMPAMGSPRMGQSCEIAALQSWRVTGFPLQWLYFDTEDHLDVVRLPGHRQDIAAILSAGD